jgi:hypothetical protein
MVGLMGLGTGLSAFSQIEQGQYAMSAAKYNAQAAERQAAEQSQAQKDKALKLSEQRRQMIGWQVAASGASNVDPNSGSPLNVMAQTAANYERDIQYAGISADEATQAGAQQAQIDIMQGRQAQMAGWIGAGSSMASGGSMMAYLSK